MLTEGPESMMLLKTAILRGVIDATDNGLYHTGTEAENRKAGGKAEDAFGSQRIEYS